MSPNLSKELLAMPVNTTVGQLPLSELRYEMHESVEPNVIVVARVWFYTGTDPALLDQIAKQPHIFVKRDVWATILCGQSTEAKAELRS